jgi:hypothetical protein
MDEQQKKKPTPKPTRKAVDMLMKVASDAKKSEPKPAVPPPDTLPEDWGLADLVRVGKSRLKRAIYGPPQPEKK